MNAKNKHFARLRELLPDEQVDQLEAEYRQDAAADSRESRKRQKERQAKQRAWREQQRNTTHEEAD